MNVMEKLSFKPLAIDGANYLSWSLDIEAHLASKALEDTIVTDAGSTLQEKAKSLILIRHHLAEPLKTQYLNEFNPRVLWDELKSRFEHMRQVSLSEARHDWINLRVQDHTTIAGYNGELFWITSHLAVCGYPVGDDEQIEKMLSTFLAVNLILATQNTEI